MIQNEIAFQQWFCKEGHRCFFKEHPVLCIDTVGVRGLPIGHPDVVCYSEPSSLHGAVSFWELKWCPKKEGPLMHPFMSAQRIIANRLQKMNISVYGLIGCGQTSSMTCVRMEATEAWNDFFRRASYGDIVHSSYVIHHVSLETQWGKR